jgi:hypothetical protein
VVGVQLVVEVEQLDCAAGVGERERDPGRRPALGADQREHVGCVDGRVLARPGGHVGAERQHALPQPLLDERAGSDLAVAGGLELLGAEIERFRQRPQVRVGAAGTELLVDRDVKQPGLLSAGQLGEQPLVLALLHVTVKIGDPSAGLGAAVDREQSAVGELQPLALAAALERVHIHAQAERLAGQHRRVQPPHRRAPRGAAHHDRLLHIPVHVGQLRVAIKIETRRSDRLLQPRARLDRLLALDAGVQLAEQLARVLGAAAAVGFGGVKARPQQPHDLFAVEQRGAHPLGLELRP